MINDLVFNDVYMSKEYIEKNSLFPKSSNIEIIGNNQVCQTLYKTFEYINETTEYKYNLDIIDKEQHIDVKDDTTYFYFFDGSAEINAVPLKQAFDSVSNNETISFVLITKLPQIPYINFADSISESELSIILKDSMLSTVESLINEYKEVVNIYDIRIDNIFGVNIEDDGRTKISELCKAINEKKEITISKEDHYLQFSAITAPDLINASLTALCKGKPCEPYNATSHNYTLAFIKEYLFNLTSSYGVSLDYNNQGSKVDEQYFSSLSIGKLESLGFETTTSKKNALRYAFMSKLNAEFNLLHDHINMQYDGKLDQIKNIEISILKEVDKICRDNDITYFLSGGSMLGAVRHGGVIPWDDDVDIAMLREDYNRFKEIAKDKISSDLIYQTYSNRDGYHFFFDKITKKDTYFATKYSDEFDMTKGISLDIFVFDKTAETTFRQKLHYKRLMYLRRVINVRWKNRARKGKMYLLSKILLPIFRLFSLDFLCEKYDKATRAYEKKDTAFVLAPATDEKYPGSMPLEWFSAVEPIKFEGIDSFIPVGYDSYLKLWYGDNYMDLLPICKRESSHDFYRLDLGKNVIQKK